VARVVLEHGAWFDVLGEDGPEQARLAGRLHKAGRADADPLERPGVGDWVALARKETDSMPTIVHRFERRSRFLRQAAGRKARPQLVAANVDTVLVVTSANRDFNPRRIDRYLAACRDGGASAVIVVNKADLCADVPALVAELGPLAEHVPVVAVSALRQDGLDELASHLSPGETLALVGSSGVGKSTLVNWLIGGAVQTIGDIREDDDRGRHTTTHRQLFPIPDGAPAAGCILIDTPGMRELQLWLEEDVIDDAFPDVDAVAARCRFADCSHTVEPACAVREALASGALDAERWRSYQKLKTEARGTPRGRRR
jgi:ribosome biogenesis GTPase